MKQSKKLLYFNLEEIKMLNQNLKDYLLDIDNLRSITRFQTAPRNAKETVAEHSFYVAAIVLKLHDYFDFTLEQALVTALMHDYAEVYISDVPHSIKVANPKISIELEAVETKINIDKLSTEIAQNIADDGADAAETAETTETVTAIGAIEIESMVAPPSPTRLAPIPTPRAD